MSLESTRAHALVQLVLVLVLAFASACSGGSSDCQSACRSVASRCGGDDGVCTSLCELRDDFSQRAGCQSEQGALNECESSASSCGSALELLCAEEASTFEACTIRYCRASPSDAVCQALCDSDSRYCS